MSIAEETIKNLIEGMTDDEKRFTAKYLDTQFMRDELNTRSDNRNGLNIELRREK